MAMAAPQFAKFVSKRASTSHNIRGRCPSPSSRGVQCLQKRISFNQCPAVIAGMKTVSGNINFWQAGVIQRFEKADMNLYAVYQFADGSFIGNAATAKSGAPIGKTEIDGFQELITGAKINF